MRVGYGNPPNSINPMFIGLLQGRTLLTILSNIYMHPFDVWVEEQLIPKHSMGVRSRANSEYTNFRRLHYVRYADGFFFGVIGSKGHCLEIRKEIKDYLAKKLALTLSIEKTKITHGETKKALFLGYNINCTPINKKAVVYNSVGVFIGRTTTNCTINAPIT